MIEQRVESGMSVPEITLWQGDCLEKMKEIADGSVDMVLTDPPSYFLVVPLLDKQQVFSIII